MYNYKFDYKSAYIILALLIVIMLRTFTPIDIITTILTLPGVIIAISFHEFAHAFVAVKLGDNTPKNQGRLTLDPSKHLEPIGIFLLIFAHMGWGKPVEINSNNFSKVSKRVGETLVAIAGPLMNFLLAFILLVIYFAIIIFIPQARVLMAINEFSFVSIAITMIYYAAIVNIGLGVFNFLPIPPLDGSKIFLHWLPYKIQNAINEKMVWIQMAFMFIFLLGLFSYITGPIINIVLNYMLKLIEIIFSIFI